ncbi:MAG: oxidoreductase [Gammaproteobacteria bacterium]|nr:oxidoreductase [Gammaproteobacteria bacterium]|tara:strand:+ start:320 stop:1087 length:768 start_codon:yes stop_codon:yes gene_type:complete
MSIKDRVALVTGGGRGVGKGISLSLAAAGASVAVNYRRDEESAAETVREIEALGGKAIAFSASVDDYEQNAQMVADIERDLGPVSILVNNAGIASRGRSVVDTDPEEMRLVVATHAFGPHYLAALTLPKMRTLGRGDIVMISSVATRSLGPNGAPYNMGKTAMEALAYTLAKEEREHGIRVNIVAPGLVDTDMGQRLIKAVQGVEDIRSLDQSMPFGRVCQPEDVANVVRFLVSDENSYLTGERLYCDGGGQLLR